MQYSEQFVKDILINRPSHYYCCYGLFECYVDHIDHVLTFAIINTNDGSLKQYTQFLSYKDIFNMYVDYSIIYYGLPYPDSAVYYDLDEVL